MSIAAQKRRRRCAPAVRRPLVLERDPPLPTSTGTGTPSRASPASCGRRSAGVPKPPGSTWRGSGKGSEGSFRAATGGTGWQRVAAAAAVLKRTLRDHGRPRHGQDDAAVAGILASFSWNRRNGRRLNRSGSPLPPRRARQPPGLQEAIREAAGGATACADGIRAKLAGMEASTLHRLLGRRPAFSSLTRFTRARRGAAAR
ncbi:MAG: hypothetical protein MZV70_12815 [Desulfobacterales bacterium]|nr:hypothetical protein [Desulfobacterales bacterium]